MKDHDWCLNFGWCLAAKSEFDGMEVMGIIICRLSIVPGHHSYALINCLPHLSYLGQRFGVGRDLTNFSRTGPTPGETNPEMTLMIEWLKSSSSQHILGR